LGKGVKHLTEILVAMITGILSLVGVVLSNLAAARRQEEKIDASLSTAQAVTDTKIEELTREVRKHNNFAERIPVIDEQIKVINHRLKDLEEQHE
jgi:uncharacterized membrane protein YecN with MAPEG domain